MLRFRKREIRLCEAGAAAVEFSIVASLFVLLVTGFLDSSFFFRGHADFSTVARVVARDISKAAFEGTLGGDLALCSRAWVIAESRGLSPDDLQIGIAERGVGADWPMCLKFVGGTCIEELPSISMIIQPKENTPFNMYGWFNQSKWIVSTFVLESVGHIDFDTMVSSESLIYVEGPPDNAVRIYRCPEPDEVPSA